MNKVFTYYYFIGVGGIGMSALARFFLAMGKSVVGYDKTASPLTKLLIQEGINLSYEDDPESIPVEIRENQKESLIIYTPAIPNDSAILNYFVLKGYEVKKRAEVLGMVTEESINLSVAGTHGKTTTSCMLAAIFKASHLKFTAFLGGISADLGSNFFHREGEGPHYSISEADEFDRSFLKLNPLAAIVTSTDADHLDIYETGEQVKESFELFAQKILDKDMLLVAELAGISTPHTSYSAESPTADFYASNIHYAADGTTFDLMEHGQVVLHKLKVKLPGQHNLENAVAAAVLALKHQIDPQAIRQALANFKGIKRRFEYLIDTEGLVYIDDYAHHPSELRALIASLRKMYPNRRILGIFQPHLYSRTQDFYPGFASALDGLDECLLLPIYPAREQPIEGVSSALIYNEMKLAKKALLSKQELIPHLKNSQLDIVLSLGAGDIDRMIESIKEALHG